MTAKARSDGARATDAGVVAEAEQVEERAEDWVAEAADWVRRMVARTREEAEDIWADAQTVRRKL